MTPVLQRIDDSIRGLAPYQPGRPIAEVARERGVGDVLKLASNENPLGGGGGGEGGASGPRSGGGRAVSGFEWGGGCGRIWR